MVQHENHWYVCSIAENPLLVVLDMELTLVIAFDTHQCRSPAYDYFNGSIIHVAHKGNVSPFFQYQYTCKLGHAGCKITKKCNAPTNKLLSLMKTCDVQQKGQSEQPEQMMLHTIWTRYCPFHHCMLIAMRCVASNRPFLSTEDYFYKLELQHICPGESFSFSILHHLLPCMVMGMNTDTV